jgi:hypothetical protein
MTLQDIKGLTCFLVNLVNKNGLQIVLQVSQVDTVSQIKASFSNQSTAPMEKLMLQLAAPKSMQLKMEPQSGQMIPPKSENAVTQNILVRNPNKVNTINEAPLLFSCSHHYYYFRNRCV